MLLCEMTNVVTSLTFAKKDLILSSLLCRHLMDVRERRVWERMYVMGYPIMHHILHYLWLTLAYSVSFETCVVLNNVCVHKCVMMELPRGQWGSNC